MNSNTIAILTDFKDHYYLSQMKSVIYSINHNVNIIDNTNSIYAFNKLNAAWQLYCLAKYAPKGTIFCCVVDPEVGTKREAIAIKTKDFFFVGPNNGIMYEAANSNKIEKIVILERNDSKSISSTFHGRDIFAYFSALLSISESLVFNNKSKYLPLKNLKRIYVKPKQSKGVVCHVDSFGNIITNVLLPEKRKKLYKVKINDKEFVMRFYKTFDYAKNNELFLIEGSQNTFEISVKQANAFEKLSKKLKNLKIGSKIEIT